MAAEVIATDRLVVVEDARTHGPRAAALQAHGLLSFAGVPLQADGGPPFAVMWVVACLPACDPAESTPATVRGSADQAPVHAPGSLRILMVEDDPGTARAAAMSLRRLGSHEVIVSEDVPEVLRLTAEGGIDAVLMDVSLSTSTYRDRLVDGLEITRLLRADSRSRGVPVLLMTAHAMAGDRERMLEESGADGYQAKPIQDYRELGDRLRGLVSRRRAEA